VSSLAKMVAFAWHPDVVRAVADFTAPTASWTLMNARADRTSVIRIPYAEICPAGTFAPVNRASAHFCPTLTAAPSAKV